jgi:hypothetical protein
MGIHKGAFKHLAMCLLCGPTIGGVGRHRQVNLWQQLRVQAVFWEKIVATDEFTAAKLQIVQQFGQIQTLVPWAEWLQMTAAAVVKLSGTASVASAEVMQAHGDLNQPLIERTRWITTLHPEIFPNLVRLEEILLVEPTDSLQISRIVTIFLHEFCLSLVRPATILGASGEDPQHRAKSKGGYSSCQDARERARSHGCLGFPYLTYGG